MAWFEGLKNKTEEQQQRNIIFMKDGNGKTIYDYVIEGGMEKARKILDENCNKFECSVCLEEYITEVAYTPICSYKHIICYGCYERMVVKRCPLCRMVYI